jgi:cupin fold WbuC family metalloprotein
MLNALQPNSYIQPHRHRAPPKAESIIVLRGAIGFVTFKEKGEVDQKFTLATGSPEVGIDTDPHVYHTFFALDDDTVLFEVKPGPYNPDTDKDPAIWAPDEGSGEAEEYLKNLYELVKETG